MTIRWKKNEKKIVPFEFQQVQWEVQISNCSKNTLKKIY